MSTPRCPTCDALLPDKARATTFPFCSSRCKLADLGSWLDGRYVVSEPMPTLPDDVLAEAMDLAARRPRS